MPDMNIRSASQPQPSVDSQPWHSHSATTSIYLRSFPRHSCMGETLYLVDFLQFLGLLIIPAFRRSLVNWLSRIWKKPTGDSLLSGSVLDLCLSRSKRELVVENALLRQQLIVLRRQVNRPQFTKADRALLVLLAGRVRTWRSALLIVQPDTLLRWHRAGFCLFWISKLRFESLRPSQEKRTKSARTL